MKLSPKGANKAAQMSDTWIDQTIEEMINRPNQTQNIIDLGNILLNNRSLINKTVTAVDKSTGEVIILSLTKY